MKLATFLYGFVCGALYASYYVTQKEERLKCLAPTCPAGPARPAKNPSNAHLLCFSKDR